MGKAVSSILHVSIDQLNRACLRAQHLNACFRASDLTYAVRDAGGLHATSPITPYLSLLARMTAFTEEDLNSALGPGGDLLRLRCIRQTIYVIPKGLAPAMFVATRRLVTGEIGKYLQYWGVGAEAYADLSARVLGLLRGSSLTINEIKRAIPGEARLPKVVSCLCDAGSLVRGVSTTGWRSLSYAYRRFDEQFPGLDLNDVSESEATQQVVRFYLNALGPATEGDVKWWTGLTLTQVRTALKDLRGELTEVYTAGLGQKMLAPKSWDSAASSQEDNQKPQVSLLPFLDPYVMGYKDRQRYLDDRWATFVFDKAGNATSVILVDGKIAGVWDSGEARKGLVKVLYFEEPSAAVLTKVEEAVKGIVSLMDGGDARIVRCATMLPLVKRTYGSMMSPLSERGVKPQDEA